MTYDGWTFTWEHGRELASMAKGGTTWTFTYDANGMRTQRTNGTTTYKYIYIGGQLTQLTVGSNKLLLAYDANGTPLAVTYNGTAYYYVTNLQGDVVAILNTSGTAVVTYSYDAWGNLLSTGGSMASTLGQQNPLRYRGYVYDTETELYYLQSRYYNPEIGRFLNADIVYDYDAGLQGLNLFIYCGNNPTSRIDISGTDSVDLLDGDKDDDDAYHDDSGGHKIVRSPDYSDVSMRLPDYSGNGGKTHTHHVVEQCQARKSGFTTEQIQAASNKVVIDARVHAAISGHYSSKPHGLDGLRVRDWLAGKSFEEQTQYGWKIVNQYYHAIMG